MGKAKILRPTHKDNITSFSKHYRFYLLRDKYQYVLAVKISGADTVDKIRYSLSGVVLGHVTDIALGDMIIRRGAPLLISV